MPEMSSILQFLQWMTLSGVLIVLAYVDRLYRELNHITSGPVRENLDEFSGRIERRLSSDRRRGASSFSMLVRLWLALTAVAAAHDIFQGSGTRAAMAAELLFLLGAEVVIGMHFLPALLVVRTRSRWLIPLIPFLRLLVLLILPVEATLHFFINMLRLAEDEEGAATDDNQEAIEALVEKATEEGIIEHDEARLIEQVMEFGDKRVSVLMTPRPDIVAIRADASLEELRRLLVERKHSRIPIFEANLDDIVGVALARDILNFHEADAAQHTVRELVRPVLFVPETKLGSELLKEMQRKNQQMAICVDEYGSTAGIVTAEDLIEEIVGEMGDERRQPAPDVVREPSGSLVLRGSLPLGRLQELFGVEWDESLENEGATTIAGLMNRVAGHVPAAGETLEFGGILFDIVEANQRKVLRVRARRNPKVTAPVAASR
jgi:CBS domain containing-hemolysin-like protein